MSYLFKPPNFITPDSVTDNVGAGSQLTGTVSDVQTMLDGNELIINEVGGAPPGPYIDTDFDFSNVAEMYGIVTRHYYDGNHTATINLYNWDATQDDAVIIGGSDPVYNVRTIFLPEDIQANYVDTGAGLGNVRVSILHSTASGNATDDFVIDYIAILGKRL